MSAVEVKKELIGTERIASPPVTLATSPGLQGGTELRQQHHLPPFSTFTAADMDAAAAAAAGLGGLQAHELTSLGVSLGPGWEYYEGLTGRLMDARGDVVLTSGQYRPWESKHAAAVAAAAAAGQEGLPSFNSQFGASQGPDGITSLGPQEPQLTTLTPLSPASMSHSPPVSLPSFHTLGAPLPAPQPHRAGPPPGPHPSLGYPLVPAPVQAREVPALQQQLVDERHIQLLGASPVQPFVGAQPPIPGPPPPGHPVHPGHVGHPGHTVLAVVKPEYPQLHHTNFQNPMSTVLDSSPGTRPLVGLGAGVGNDGRKKDRRKIRDSPMESEDSVGQNTGSENSGQVAAVSSTANRGGHHMGGGHGDGDGVDGTLGDKPTKKKRKRCGECIGCQRKDNCGDCAPCRNDKSHQICKMRRCEKLTEKKVSVDKHLITLEFC
ncbi:hypothetical protein QAD02_001577 [Eretmocerus hayati]|uniref:Uncharacterized protein n=1 Tax=Eretmocerus hayati TaxID=131215 RepID=A0ACC2NHD8_9HYME|nr:hypothetical protein QAD02_001577 [Eretmocerus hayati]